MYSQTISPTHYELNPSNPSTNLLLPTAIHFKPIEVTRNVYNKSRIYIFIQRNCKDENYNCRFIIFVSSIHYIIRTFIDSLVYDCFFLQSFYSVSLWYINVFACFIHACMRLVWYIRYLWDCLLRKRAQNWFIQPDYIRHHHHSERTLFLILSDGNEYGCEEKDREIEISSEVSY